MHKHFVAIPAITYGISDTYSQKSVTVLIQYATTIFVLRSKK